MVSKHNHQWAVGRETRASTYFAILFGTSVITILTIRGFLAITGYPQLGGDSLHIAHMLWGGLFMLAAMIILIYLHGHRAKVLGAFIGGIGFGFFIDELGKFITNDNDYFYQPTAMLIYVIFLLLWALFEWLDNYVPSTPRQKFVELLTRMRDSSIHGVTLEDSRTVTILMADLGMSKNDQKKLLGLIDTYAPKYKPDTFVSAINATVRKTESSVEYIVKSKVTPIVIYIIITLSAIASFAILLISIANRQDLLDVYSNVPTFIEIGLIIFSTLTILSVVIGVSYSKRNWYKTLVWYRRALLVNVFGTQVFLFYINQFTAAFGLLFSLVILYALTLLIDDYEKNQ